MNIKVKKTVEVIIESINFIIITYALSGMAMSFRTNPVYILFFVFFVWLIGRYISKLKNAIKSNLLTAIIFCCSFGIFCLITYFTGYTDVNLIPFSK